MDSIFSPSSPSSSRSMTLEDINSKQPLKTAQALIESIDSGEHNDVEIVLDDGVIKASKLILSSRSEYFQMMFDKNSQFQEQRQGSVTLQCKKLIMRKILEHLYGGKLDVSDCTCVEIVEMLNMLRLLLLKDTFDALEDYLKEQLGTRPIEEVLEAVELANSMKLEWSMLNLATRLAIDLEEFGESFGTLSCCVVFHILDAKGCMEKNDEKCFGPRPPSHQLEKLMFVVKWLVKNPKAESFRIKIPRFFDLPSFEVEHLLREVRDSNLFSDKDIFDAVNIVHKKVKEENKQLKREMS